MKKIISLLAALAVITASSFSVMAEGETVGDAGASKTEVTVTTDAENAEEVTDEAAEETADEATEETAEETADEATEETAEETADDTTAPADETEAVDYSKFDAEGIDVVVLGQKVEFDVQPEMQNDRVMVPVRAIFEALGADVTWEDETQTVMAVKDERVVLLQIGNTKMFVDGNEAVELDAPPILKDDSRTLVPVRAISEAFDYDVEWIDETEMVVVSEKAAEAETTEEEPKAETEDNTVIGEADEETDIVVEDNADAENKEATADNAEKAEEAAAEAEAEEVAADEAENAEVTE